ncbi:hypothetical protein [Deinococcus sonorensis]|uniref:Uncharacterized protein n=2 Tax=Deinococcus sonorensis TaxID=309891 RepID=A0AAU7U659_9DEIO
MYEGQVDLSCIAVTTVESPLNAPVIDLSCHDPFGAFALKPVGPVPGDAHVMRQPFTFTLDRGAGRTATGLVRVYGRLSTGMFIGGKAQSSHPTSAVSVKVTPAP